MITTLKSLGIEPDEKPIANSLAAAQQMKAKARETLDAIISRKGSREETPEEETQIAEQMEIRRKCQLVIDRLGPNGPYATFDPARPRSDNEFRIPMPRGTRGPRWGTTRA